MRHHGVDQDVVDRKARIAVRRLTADVQEHAVADLEHIGLVDVGLALPPQRW